MNRKGDMVGCLMGWSKKLEKGSCALVISYCRKKIITFEMIKKC